MNIHTEKEFGPPASLLKRRLWGAVAIVTCFIFFALVLMVDWSILSYQNLMPQQQSSGFFVSDGSEPPSILGFILASVALFGAIIGAHFYTEKRYKNKQ